MKVPGTVSASTKTRGRGLWVECSTSPPVLGSREAVDKMIADARLLGVTDLYVQVAREGCLWYPDPDAASIPAETAPEVSGDTFGYLLDQARLGGVRVHGWVNLYNLGRNSAALLLAHEGGELLIRDNFGRRVDEVEKASGGALSLDAPLLWLDPALPEVRSYIGRLVSSLSNRYPELDGVHLDFVRYPYCVPIRPSSTVKPGVDFGYSEASVNAFVQRQEGARLLVLSDAGSYQPTGYTAALLWDDFRRVQVTSAVEQIRDIIGAERILSVAALAWPDRAYLSAFQDWRSWLVDGLVDQVCLMSYTRDRCLFAHLIRQAAAFQCERSAVWGGIGAYLFNSLPEIGAQIQLVRAGGARGEILFSYGNLVKAGLTGVDPGW